LVFEIKILEGELIDIEIRNINLLDVSLEKILDLTIKKGLRSAIWQNPDQKEIHCIVNFSEGLREYTHPNLEQMPSGFLVSPYENDNNLLYYYIHADLHFVLIDNNISLLNYDHNIPFRQIEDLLEQSQVLEKKSFQEQYSKSIIDDCGLERTEFENFVELSIKRIEQGEFQKVVPSRSREIDLPDHFNIISKFNELCIKHPEAFVSLFHLPEKEIWIGASPELLIKISNNKLFYTSALAGTQSGKDILNLSEVAWTQKEIEEQAYVSRYIINCFKKIRLREFEEKGPRTIEAGGLVHLRTDYQVDLETVNFPQLGSVMLKLLHPTSAVCGMPKEPAASFIKASEKIDREFYSGYLGPVNIDSVTNLFVNLRCAKIHGGKATLYAGAGVTRDSNPDKEWRETELKMSTIKDVLLS
jgi:isochorismate synthase